SRRVAYPIGKNPLSRNRYAGSRRVLAVSRFVAESVETSGIPAQKITVVYEGVEIPPTTSESSRARAREIWGIGEQEQLLGCVGYLLPEKGQETIVRAMPMILSANRNVRLLLAGDGACRARLEDLVSSLGLGRSVIFAGFVENVRSVYDALDVFVFPSLAEPLRTSLFAAMASGLPVVAVASGGVPEYVADEENGLLVSRSSEEQVAKSVGRLLEDDGLRTKVSNGARSTIEKNFSASRMVENTLGVYCEVLRE